MKTNTTDIGNFLEAQAKVGSPITYAQVRTRFPDLPEFNGIWCSHPLSWMFGELDEDDHANNRPFRTALVITQDHPQRPGPGFFKAISTLRNTPPVIKSDLDTVWMKELKAVIAYYT